ncbi:MAG: PAS domain S-box protein [Gracilimonas sp.]|nr:PAS domain S-box protein [Gracilimonas sp.]
MESVKNLLDSIIFRTAMEQIPASVVITNADAEIVYVNKYFTELTGYSAEEAQGKKPSILKSDAQPQAFYRDMWETLLSGKTWRGEFKNVKKDGSYYWEKASIDPIYDDKGEITYFLAIKQDITEEKEQIEEAERRERLLNNIQEISETGGWEYDLRNDMYFWTDELYNIHEFEKPFKGNLAEESLKCYNKPDRDKIYGLFRKCVEQGIPYDYTARFTDLKGKEKWVRTKSQAIKNKKGKVVRVIGSVRDVTDEVETLHALKRSQNEFKTVVESFDDIVFTLDEEGRHTNLYGKWGQDEELRTMMLGKTAVEVYGEEAGRPHIEALQAAKDEGQFTYKWHIQNEEGKRNYYETKLTQLKGANSGIEGYLGVGRNITAEMRYREELEELKERLNYALIGTRAGTWDWDIESGKTIFNERWAQMLGYTLDDLEPTYIETWNNLTHPKDLKKTEEKLHKYFKGDIPMYDVKVRMQHKDGHWVWVWDRGAIFEEDEDGKPTRMVGTHIDVTEWMEAEQHLKLSERKYRELFENSSDASMLEKGGYIVDCNQALLDLLGYNEKNELIGKTILEISPEKQSSGWSSEKLFNEALGEMMSFRKKGLQFEWEHFKKDGSLVPVEVVLTNLIDDDGDSMRYAVYRDITDRKAAENELMDAYEERGALLAEIHHRVKNNLAIISGLIQLQMFCIEDEETAEQLNKSVNRIKSIALIHEQLYQSKNFVRISLKENIESQAKTLIQDVQE